MINSNPITKNSQSTTKIETSTQIKAKRSNPQNKKCNIHTYMYISRKKERNEVLGFGRHDCNGEQKKKSLWWTREVVKMLLK